MALATHSYTLQLLRYVFLISLAIGWACEIMVGRLVGAGHFRQAHDLVRKGVEVLGGKGGGGRADMAQGGGPDADKAADAIDALKAALAG